MNIFYLSDTPRLAAKDHCDKHIVKMILEYAQLLSTAHRVLDGDEWADKNKLYKATHKNHPSAVWARDNKINYLWLWELLSFCCEEYTKRYNKVHATQRKGLMDTLREVPNNIIMGKATELVLTRPPQCMPDEYKCDDTIKAYRDYYLGEKISFAKWNYSKTPDWFLLGVSDRVKYDEEKLDDYLKDSHWAIPSQKSLKKGNRI